MNEDIVKKLIKQATEDVLGVKQVDQKLYTELVVKECSNICDDHPTWTARMVGNQIKDHFGVK